MTVASVDTIEYSIQQATKVFGILTRIALGPEQRRRNPRARRVSMRQDFPVDGTGFSLTARHDSFTMALGPATGRFSHSWLAPLSAPCSPAQRRHPIAPRSPCLPPKHSPPRSGDCLRSTSRRSISRPRRLCPDFHRLRSTVRRTRTTSPTSCNGLLKRPSLSRSVDRSPCVRHPSRSIDPSGPCHRVGRGSRFGQEHGRPPRGGSPRRIHGAFRPCHHSRRRSRPSRLGTARDP